MNMITFSGIDVDLSALEQLVHKSQSRCILDTLLLLRGAQNRKSVLSMVEYIENEWDMNEGLSVVSPNGYPAGDYVRPRRFELVGALNRIRGLSVF
jgi:hypothetical protein